MRRVGGVEAVTRIVSENGSHILPILQQYFDIQALQEITGIVITSVMNLL